MTATTQVTARANQIKNRRISFDLDQTLFPSGSEFEPEKRKKGIDKNE